VQCQKLNIPCAGFGQRPEWMDGSIRQRAKLQTIKLAVARNSAQKHPRLEERQPVQQMSPISLSDDGPSFLQQRESENTSTFDLEFSKFLDGRNENTNHARNSCIDGDEETLTTQKGYSALFTVNTEDSLIRQTENPFHSLTLKHALMIMKFITNEFSSNYSLSLLRKGSFNQGWYLWLLSKSRSLYLTTLALTACYENLADSSSATIGGDEELALWYGMAIIELQGSLHHLHVTDDSEPDIGDLCVLSCMFMLTKIDVGSFME
jgi:hypothetical protein